MPTWISPLGTAEVAAAGQLCQPGMLRSSGEVSVCIPTALMEPSLNTPKLSSATNKPNPCLQRIKQDLLTLCDCWWNPVRFQCLVLDSHHTRLLQRYPLCQVDYVLIFLQWTRQQFACELKVTYVINPG